MALIESSDLNKFVPQNMYIVIGNTICTLLLHSGIDCSMLHLSLARQIMYNCEKKWSDKKPLELKLGSNETVETLGILRPLTIDQIRTNLTQNPALTLKLFS